MMQYKDAASHQVQSMNKEQARSGQQLFRLGPIQYVHLIETSLQTATHDPRAVKSLLLTEPHKVAVQVQIHNPVTCCLTISTIPNTNTFTLVKRCSWPLTASDHEEHQASMVRSDSTANPAPLSNIYAQRHACIFMQQKSTFLKSPAIHSEPSASDLCG